MPRPLLKFLTAILGGASLLAACSETPNTIAQIDEAAKSGSEADWAFIEDNARANIAWLGMSSDRENTNVELFADAAAYRRAGNLNAASCIYKKLIEEGNFEAQDEAEKNLAKIAPRGFDPQCGFLYES